MSVPHSALHSKVRKAAPEQRQSASCRLHAGASTDVETTRYSALRGILLVVALVRFAFYPYHSIPGRLRHGQTVTHSALCRPSYLRMPQGGKSPLCVCPADHCLSRPAVVPFILSIPTGSIPATPPIPFYPS